jgi:hypothetical protein
LQDQPLTLLREQVGDIVLGAIFLFIGLAACAIAAVRGRGRVRILTWFGIFSGIYGLRIFAQHAAAFRALPQFTWPARQYVIAALTYLILVPALLFWMELSVGQLRRLLQCLTIAACSVAVSGISSDLVTRSPFSLAMYNRVLVIVTLLVLATVNSVPALGGFLIFPSRISGFATLALAFAVLYSNLNE